jgi:hypothetical protein
MRSKLRIFALIMVLAMLLVPLTTYASGHGHSGPCPDDPYLSKKCDKPAPPFYVVINRSTNLLHKRPGTGCQPFILKHPEIRNCILDGDNIDLEAEVCKPMSYKWVANADGSNPFLYEMCCDCATKDGYWLFRLREWKQNGECPVIQDWTRGLPPGTGIDLPAPVVVGGLAFMGVSLVSVGLVVRRRSMRLV